VLRVSASQFDPYPTLDESLDHLINNGEQPRRKGQTERLGSLEVNDELKFSRPQYRQVRGLPRP
jgi:hypothetical protein